MQGISSDKLHKTALGNCDRPFARAAPHRSPNRTGFLISPTRDMPSRCVVDQDNRIPR